MLLLVVRIFSLSLAIFNNQRKLFSFCDNSKQ